MAAAAEAELRAARSETLSVLLHLRPVLQCGAALMLECPAGCLAVLCSTRDSALQRAARSRLRSSA